MVIHKYKSRRLYDTESARYVTLQEVADWARQGRTLRVVEVGSGRDLTQATLLQILLECRGGGRYLSVESLARVLALSDAALAELLGAGVDGALGERPAPPPLPERPPLAPTHRGPRLGQPLAPSVAAVALELGALRLELAELRVALDARTGPT